MTSLKTLPWSRPSHSTAPLSHPVRHPVRQLAAAALQSASVALSHLAARLAAPAARPPVQPPVFEFHAEAGAPEGALFIDGELVGWLPGVTRL